LILCKESKGTRGARFGVRQWTEFEAAFVRAKSLGFRAALMRPKALSPLRSASAVQESFGLRFLPPDTSVVGATCLKKPN